MQRAIAEGESRARWRYNHDLGGCNTANVVRRLPGRSEILREEVFGPVLTLSRSSREERIAPNDTTRLAAIMTGRSRTKERVSARLSPAPSGNVLRRDLKPPWRLANSGADGGWFWSSTHADVKNVCTARNRREAIRRGEMSRGRGHVRQYAARGTVEINDGKEIS